MLDQSKQTNLLDIRGVCRSFPKGSGEDLLVLENVDLTIQSGEIVGLLGRSGSGKSTLLRIIAGLIAPSSGHAKCRGETIVGPATGVSMGDSPPERRTGPRSAGYREFRAPHAGTRGDRPDRSRRI